MKIKLLSVFLALTLISSGVLYAATGQIGTGSITGGGTTPIIISDINNISGATASGSLNIQVTATVLPTLSMTLSTPSINFGTLSPGVEQSGSLTMVTSSNGNGGITVNLSSLTGLYSSNLGKYIGNTGSGTATPDATDYYKVSSSTNSAGTPLSLQNVGTSQTILSSSDVAKSNATTTIALFALAGNQTEAGNYSDTLTFTITGQF